MNIVVRKAEASDCSAFCMLWRFYQYHQSTFDFEDVGSDGHFDLDDEYLNSVAKGEEECDPYLIFSDDQVAGFVTVEPTLILGQEMPELSDIFILPKYRGKGIGKFVVKYLMHPNTAKWHVAVYQKDVQALQFWVNLFSKLSDAKVEKVEPAETEGFHEYIVINS